MGHLVGAEVIFSYHVPPGIHTAILVEHGTSTRTTDGCNFKYKAGAIIAMRHAAHRLLGLVLEATSSRVTTAGTFAVWTNAAITSFVTVKAWLRALTLNLGSIFFGSLSVVIL
ncbi:unnamed protein product [Peronospora effusa]|nr:unnamed protein product [Peronospora effusa]